MTKAKHKWTSMKTINISAKLNFKLLRFSAKYMIVYCIFSYFDVRFFPKNDQLFVFNTAVVLRLCNCSLLRHLHKCCFMKMSAFIIYDSLIFQEFHSQRVSCHNFITLNLLFVNTYLVEHIVLSALDRPVNNFHQS